MGLFLFLNRRLTRMNADLTGLGGFNASYFRGRTKASKDGVGWRRSRRVDAELRRGRTGVFLSFDVIGFEDFSFYVFSF